MSIRILVVDDSPTIRDGLRHLPENHADWEVCGEAADGIEAIEKYGQLKPDLLVVDVSMPRMNGLDASLELLKLSPRILIMLCTSYLTAQLTEEAHKAGIRGTVSKDAMHVVVVGLEALLRGEHFSGPPRSTVVRLGNGSVAISIGRLPACHSAQAGFHKRWTRSTAWIPACAAMTGNMTNGAG